jgi:DinB superfamily
MENAPVKSRLIEMLRRARADQEALLSSLSAEELGAAGTPERWSAKDLMAHIAFWEERMMQRLAARARGESFSELSDGEVDGVNAGVFEENRGRSWDQVQADAERVFDQLIAMVSQYGEPELTDPAPVGWYRDRSLLASIVGNSFTHPQMHISWFHLQRGDIARAREMQEAMAKAQVDMDGSPDSRALAFYNLACFYALIGEPVRAVQLLRQALPLRADLVEWSRQDPDLASLHDRADYQALYEGQEGA